MRAEFSPKVERGRSVHPVLGATCKGDTFGWFKLRQRPGGPLLQIMVGDGEGWDHVSVSLASGKRLPTWDEMCWVKHLFFEPDECVVQYHPPAEAYVNHGPVLHLWRPQAGGVPMPPLRCV